MQVECIKVAACLLYLLVINRGFSGLFCELKAEIVDKPLETAKLLVPSLLYVVQNNLLFVAVSNLDPGAYQVTSQLKTLVTALFAILILGVSVLCYSAFTNDAMCDHGVTPEKNNFPGVDFLALACHRVLRCVSRRSAPQPNI